ncbi:MAG: FlgD immunoglobulin-like domain containing protein, partial [Candidatus Cloacimonadales bacterium]|nr:FlgD immunoglobulin-like domain containing protein [Candidatus Cloacimonadales bacterium]
PWGYDIDSVIVRLYQFNSIGGPPTQYFPVWNVAGGDTIKCILNHIDYGFELDPDDWEKGDVGNPYTYTNNVGTVTDSEEDGYRYVDVTDCVLFDYQQERTFSQYRIAFQIDTDWDDHHDYVSFTTADATGNFYWPNLFIYLSTDVNIEENEVEFIETFAYVSPNPFNPETTISFSIPEDSKVGITIYNIKGQKVKTLVSEDLEKGIHKIIWDSKDSIGKSVSSGVYFYKLDVNGKTKGLKKMLLLK